MYPQYMCICYMCNYMVFDLLSIMGGGVMCILYSIHTSIVN